MKFLWVFSISLGLLQCQTFHKADKVSDKGWKLPWKKSQPKGYQNIKKSDFFETTQTSDSDAGEKLSSSGSQFHDDHDHRNHRDKAFLDTQLQNHTAKLSLSDLQKLDQYKQPSPGSISEAALVVGLLKATAHQQTAANASTESTFKESDTLADSAKINLGELSEVYQVDPIGALKQNHFLQSDKVTELALLATKTTKKSVVYDRQVAISMNKRIDRWHRMRQRYQAEPNSTPTEAQAQNIDAVEQAPQTFKETPAISRLKEQEPRKVSSHSDHNTYKEVESFTRDGDGNTKNLKIADESAVETLRQKAAAAYQSSLPIRSPKAKLRHLTKAKKYLQYAMNRYKGNHQNDKLQNNLEVVEEAIQATRDRIKP